MDLVPELAERLASDAQLHAAFERLTPGRQREYNHHISTAKQAETRRRRIDKFAPKILAGLGMRQGETRKPLPDLKPGEVRLLSGGEPADRQGRR